MRHIVLSLGILSLVMGQAPSLAWVELADTVYGISGSQDTFMMVIQKRSGNVRLFELYDTLGSTLFIAGRDSVFLDANARISRIRRYERPNGNSPFSLWAEYQFSYPSSPAIKIEVTDGISPNVQADAFFYGLTITEGSLVWSDVLGIGGFAIPVDVYPQGYRTGQYGDSVLGRFLSSNQAIAFVRKARPGDCDTLTVYSGPANNPSTPILGTKICHTSGFIDSVVSQLEQIYWSYNANNRPIRRIQVSDSGTDTTFYSYDAAGRLAETRESMVTPNGPLLRRYLLRYTGAPSSLASELEKGCLSWDAVSRRGSLPCKFESAVTGLQLYDLYGRVVWEGKVQGSEVFEVPASIPAGVYHLRVGEGVARLYLLP